MILKEFDHNKALEAFNEISKKWENLRPMFAEEFYLGAKWQHEQDANLITRYEMLLKTPIGRVILNYVDVPPTPAVKGFSVVNYDLAEDLTEKIEKILSVCEGNEGQMWSAKIIGILLDCDFRDAKEELSKRKFGGKT